MMEIIISDTKEELGKRAAAKGADLIRRAINEQGEATIIVATGASQFEMLGELVKEDVDWSVVTAFHLDEYIGISEVHPASFRKYLKVRFADLLPLRKFNYVNGSANLHDECKRLHTLINEHPIDVAFIGIGENGHLAFNDPPADFETEEPYLVVNLDEACRRQQLGEGWFNSFEDVPAKAISMSITQIMKSKAIVCSVPDERKAQAVYNAINGEISTMCPASILQRHKQTFLFLDTNAAVKL